MLDRMPEQPFRRVMMTGHRPFSLSEEQRIFMKDAIERVASHLANEHGMTEMISGMALGADTIWAEFAVAHGIDLAAYIPFPQQPDKWSLADRNTWKRLVEHAARTRTFGESFSTKLLFARNTGMIEDSDLVVAAISPSLGERTGTMSAVREAHRRKRPMILINLDEHSITFLKGRRRNG